MIIPEDSPLNGGRVSPAPAGYQLRALALRDAPAGLRLSRQAGWNQTLQDWKMILGLGCCSGLFQQDALVATTATLHWGRFAWIAMVLVDIDHRRRGLGSYLLQLHLGAAQKDGKFAALDASEQGLPLYLKQGFREVCRFTRYVAKRAPAISAVAPKSCLANELAGLDEQHTRLGDRSLLFRAFSERNLPVVKASAAFGFLRLGDFATQIGPLIAPGSDQALQLFKSVSALSLQPTLLVDAPDFQAEFRCLLHDAGFTPQRSFVRMLRAGDPGLIHPSRCAFAVAGPELG